MGDLEWPPAYVDVPALPRRRRARARGLLAVAMVGVVTTALVVIVVVATAHHVLRAHPTSSGRDAVPVQRADQPPPTQFAGYQVPSSPHEISAAWFQPRITGHFLGSESTWISAQGAQEKEFLQIGTTYEATSANPDDVGNYVFWSDPLQHFYAVPLLTGVREGDFIRVSMTRTGARWTLRATDVTQRISREQVVTFPRRDQFNLTSFIQEDPSLGGTAEQPWSPSLYATTTRVTFRQLRLNNRPVGPLPLDDRSVMAIPQGVYLEPTAVHDSSFSVVPLQGAAREFSRVAAIENVSNVPVVAAFTLWPQLPAAERSRWLRLEARHLARARARLLAMTWPRRDRADLMRYAASCAQVAADLRQLARNPPSSLTPIDAQFINANYVEALSRLVQKIGLPPTD